VALVMAVVILLMHLVVWAALQCAAPSEAAAYGFKQTTLTSQYGGQFGANIAASFVSSKDSVKTTFVVVWTGTAVEFFKCRTISDITDCFGSDGFYSIKGTYVDLAASGDHCIAGEEDFDSSRGRALFWENCPDCNMFGTVNPSTVTGAGASVAVVEEFFAVGMPEADKVQVYRCASTSCKSAQQLTGPSGAQFGYAVAVARSKPVNGYVAIAVGAPAWDGGRGIVYYYSCDPVLASCTQTNSVYFGNGGHPNDHLGAEVVMARAKTGYFVAFAVPNRAYNSVRRAAFYVQWCPITESGSKTCSHIQGYLLPAEEPAATFMAIAATQQKEFLVLVGVPVVLDNKGAVYLFACSTTSLSSSGSLSCTLKTYLYPNSAPLKAGDYFGRGVALVPLGSNGDVLAMTCASGLRACYGFMCSMPSGTCACAEGWTGSVACNQCQSGYSGPDCKKTPPATAAPSTAAPTTSAPAEPPADDDDADGDGSSSASPDTILGFDAWVVYVVGAILAIFLVAGLVSLYQWCSKSSKRDNSIEMS